jgi:hypothetical protein
VRVEATETSGSRAIPQDGHAPGLFSRTSGHIGQTYAGATADSDFVAGAMCVLCALAAGGEGEDFAGAGIPSITRFGKRAAG